jgi:hypothetical protein
VVLGEEGGEDVPAALSENGVIGGGRCLPGG